MYIYCIHKIFPRMDGLIPIFFFFILSGFSYPNDFAHTPCHKRLQGQVRLWVAL